MEAPSEMGIGGSVWSFTAIRQKTPAISRIIVSFSLYSLASFVGFAGIYANFGLIDGFRAGCH